MSRTVKGSKPAGYDYNANRPGNKCWSMSPSNRGGASWQKRVTHKAERKLNRARAEDFQ